MEQKMNFKLELTSKQQNLLEQIDYPVIDKEYSNDEVKNCVNYIIDHCMSLSSKNNDLANEMRKYDELMNLLIKNENIY